MTGMIEAWGELTVREAFGEAARAFAELVRSLPADSWDRPGLGKWSVRDLVGHTSRALITVETYLKQPAETEDVSTRPAISPGSGRSTPPLSPPGAAKPAKVGCGPDGRDRGTDRARAAAGRP